MESFVYEGHPGRTLFGTGTLGRLSEEIDRLGLQRLVLISGPQQEATLQDVAGRLGGRVAGLFAQAAMHTPTDVTAKAMELVTASKADGVLALGGGSAIGLGKAIAYRTDLPQVVVPTSYAGSEMTPILGQTENGAKTTVRDSSILPELVVYDVDLTLTLPVAMSVTSGFNAIAHAVEALYARDRNPVTDLIAVEAVRALTQALPRIVQDPADVAARGDALYGAWLAGTCLGTVGMSLHHKLCHVLGGSFNLPHAETHTIVLPHALAYNRPAIDHAVRRLAPVLGDDPAAALHALAGELGAPRALAELGMPEEGIATAVEQALATPYWNPRALEAAGLRELIARAWSGAEPQPPAEEGRTS
jgi:maleylacetate reductase